MEGTHIPTSHSSGPMRVGLNNIAGLLYATVVLMVQDPL